MFKKFKNFFDLSKKSKSSYFELFGYVVIGLLIIVLGKAIENL